jgi:hypothetical protein
MFGARVPTAVPLGLGLLLLGLLPGCDGRISQCNALISVINAEQEPIKKASGGNPEALRKLGDAIENVSTKVSEVQVEDAKILEFRNKYAEMAKEVAAAARDTAIAIEAKDHKKATEAAELMSSFGTRESELVGEINGYCSPKQ